MNTAHRPNIKRTEDGRWRGICSCGWITDIVYFYAGYAENRAIEHAEEKIKEANADPS